MKIDEAKLDIERARKVLKLNELGVSKATIKRIRAGEEIKPCTVGKIAKALGCDVTDILE